MKEKIAFRTFFGFIIALALTACRVGKEYQRPPVELPQQFRGQSFADTNSIADIEWKHKADLQAEYDASYATDPEQFLRDLS